MNTNLNLAPAPAPVGTYEVTYSYEGCSSIKILVWAGSLGESYKVADAEMVGYGWGEVVRTYGAESTLLRQH